MPWVSVYPRATEEEEFPYLNGVSRTLSEHLHATVIGVMINKSTCFRYALYEGGALR